MAVIRIKRGTLSQINIAASASALQRGELYLISDTGELAVGVSNDDYQICSKKEHSHYLSDLLEKSYNSLTDKPFIPTALSELNKDINFDELYYTESEINSLLSSKAESTHIHNISDITDIDATTTEINYLVGTSSPIQSQLNMKLEWVTPPLTRNSPGTPGQIAFEDDYFFICVAQDLWARTILTKGF